MIETVIEVTFYLSTAVTLFIFMLPSQYEPTRNQNSKLANEPKTSVQVLVLGDIGRSPRMQYHALSIAQGGGKVDLIGYHDSEVHPDISSNPNVSIVPLPSHPSSLQTSNRLFFLVFGPLKVLFQIISLWWILAYRTKPAKWLLVQNPPSIPTLAIASLVCFFRQTKLVIDWHNFGYTILALKLGDSHPLVKVSRWYERVLCRSAVAHLCVTQAMASFLKNEFGLGSPIVPLHDRPASHFRPMIEERERLEFLLSLPETTPVRGLIKKNKLKVIVSSTSWTPDEDFSLLIDALCQYSELSNTSKPHLPHILAIITGKGPQREMYMERISNLQKDGELRKVTICTAWLSTDDYARLLASASLGVSLHTSSSGVDLPMKVVDMFGSGLPVLGWSRFEAWPELVTEGVNGKGFGSSDELVEQLIDLLGNPDKLESLRAGARDASSYRWDDEWTPKAGKLFGLV
ncbi:Putative Catalytic activity: GDP-Man dolichol-PP-GlcNAc2-_ dolichol-PP-GlcNAc2-Man GDP (Precursor) [Aspergillus calidoustus]|uniref:Chitobiosyldiphosphodolichol beta-mannosyltransferase n=1 Tax=Aspergillus calidoustus TaxID=454130 RepID=A0A0U5CGG2_ASPCI|nr:Putative Catalytic activity: GDP-Man dolichol-PP-GlcNAc2-> dolichol-PP-GlcNAc2-Man GDP (Precursor) [Aspergillus calidoustus]